MAKMHKLVTEEYRLDKWIEGAFVSLEARSKVYW